MTYSPGDEVHVQSFGTGTVREVRNGGRYLVEIKGRAMVVSASQLSAATGRKGRASNAAAPESGGIPDELARAHAASSLDLHGFTVEQAVAALDRFLDDAIRAGVTEVRVIHGRSGGTLKAVVHVRLRELTAIRGFRVDPRNAGVTVISL